MASSFRGRALLLLAGGVSGLRVPPEGFSRSSQFSRPPAALPPALSRDVAAEAAAAASLLRKDLLPLTGTDEGENGVKPLVLVAVRDHQYAQLVCELVQHITTGKRAGTSWCRPLALRRAENTTLAVAAEKFDPIIGWLDEDVGGCSVHLFSAAPPAAFVPTRLCADVPPTLSLAVRSLVASHEAAEPPELLLSAHAAAQQQDFQVLQSFMALVAQEELSSDDDDDGNGDGLYDPLANF